MSSVVVIDYGIGNLHSVSKALAAVGADVQISSDPAVISAAEHLVLPGVGAFADGMKGLAGRGLIEPIKAFAKTGRPFMGICLGMQLLFEESSEFGKHEGLAVLPGTIEAIQPRPGYKVPHIGWNRLQPRPGASWQGSVFQDLPAEAMAYFVHSFYAVPRVDEHRLADTAYAAQRLSAAVCAGNVIGCQFHPEKSGPLGLSVLKRFIAL
jgi:glutamine amidotransferase